MLDEQRGLLADLFIGLPWQRHLDVAEALEAYLAAVAATDFLDSEVAGLLEIDGNVIPVFTILFSWLVLNEMITAKKIIGMSMVILGVLISQLNFRLLKSKSSDKYRGT